MIVPLNEFNGPEIGSRARVKKKTKIDLTQLKWHSCWHYWLFSTRSQVDFDCLDNCKKVGQLLTNVTHSDFFLFFWYPVVWSENPHDWYKTLTNTYTKLGYTTPRYHFGSLFRASARTLQYIMATTRGLPPSTPFSLSLRIPPFFPLWAPPIRHVLYWTSLDWISLPWPPHFVYSFRHPVAV